MRTLLVHLYLVLKSNYTLKDKLKALNTLNVLYLKSLMFGKKQFITHCIFGFKITAYDYITLLNLFKEIFMTEQYFFSVTGTDSPRIIDCGANIGMSVIYFKYLFPECRIIAFEPNPDAFYLLEKNIANNNLKNIETKNYALSNKTDSIDFYSNGHKGSLIASTIKERGGNNRITVKSEKLSAYINENTFDLIKMDIEGAEEEVIDELYLSNKIKYSIRYIIEYHHRIDSKKTSLAMFLKKFEDSGFSFNISATFKNAGDYQFILINLQQDNLCK